MTMEKFIESLKNKLDGEIPAREVDKIISYYINYISVDEKTRLIELGDPRLIAKSIIDAEVNLNNKSRRKNINVDDVYFDDNEKTKRKRSDNRIIINLSKWYNWVIIALILLLIISVISFAIGALIKIVLTIIIYAAKIIIVFAVPIVFVSFIYLAINRKRK